jgi:predicted secreted protein
MKSLSMIMLAILLILAGCEKTQLDNSVNPKPDYEIAVNGTIQFSLSSNPTTGYSWNWSNKHIESKVDTFDHTFVPDKPILIGSGGREIWNFKAIKIGVDTIILDYCRPWDSNSTIQSKKIIVRIK